MSRMFLIDGKPMKTWNVFVGCLFECTYCNARKTALTRLKDSPRYKEGFKPHLISKEMVRRFSSGSFVFISYMGDISFAPLPIVSSILTQVRAQPNVNFLVCSKNPRRYWMWPANLPNNLYPGATIETTADYSLSKAPTPLNRYLAMRNLQHPKKFISIEPICEFDLDTMLSWMEQIKPEIIEVGADNYHNNLPEPSWGKVETLLRALRVFVPKVIEKPGLERLRRK